MTKLTSRPHAGDVGHHTITPYRRPRTSVLASHRAVASARTAFAARQCRYRHELEPGTLLFRQVTPSLWRIAALNPAGERTAVGFAWQDRGPLPLVRTVAEALHRAPAATGAPAGDRPHYDPRHVAMRMRTRRATVTPSLRADTTVATTVMGAQLIIGPTWLEATTARGGVRLSLEGPWSAEDVARLADAIVRDHVPQARHRISMTTPRGYYYNESGSRLYDGSLRVICSCGWSGDADDRANASVVAAGHRRHPWLSARPGTPVS